LREQSVQVARCALALRSRLPNTAMSIAIGRATLLAKLPVGPLLDRLAGLIEGEPAGVIRLDDQAARLLPARFTVEGAMDKRLVGEQEAADNRPREIDGVAGPFLGRD